MENSYPEKPEESKDVKIKQPPVLFRKTQKIIKEISSRVGGILLTYWNNPGGSVCDNDVVAFYQMLKSIGYQERIYLFLKSCGGNVEVSIRLINLLREYCGEIVALIPLECSSAATMIALGANEIRMGPMAYLGAVDTSLTHDMSPVDRDNDLVSVSLDELKRIVRLWSKESGVNSDNPYHALFPYIHPLVIGAVDRADSLSVMLCKEILLYHIDDKSKAESIATALNSKYPSHSFPILQKEACKLGLNVAKLDNVINDLLLDLNELYSEMGQKAITDFSELKYHNNEICNIIETDGLQIYFKWDKDWYYRSAERRWVPMNDESHWWRCELSGGKLKNTMFHLA